MSEAFFISFCISWMAAALASRSFLSWPMVFSPSAMSASRLAFLSPCSSALRLLLASSSLHQSRCWTSSCCCDVSSTTILSMDAFTFSKASSCAETASMASWGTPALRSTFAAFWRAAAAGPPAVRAELVCRKEGVLTVLSNTSNASSELRYAMVSATAAISSRRLFVRASYSAPVSPHFFLRLRRNSSSTSTCALTSFSSL
mmetsp:Transcript_125791/g.391725  ORF Transcript_125791/g.391725 Transcript_125791/m.391725 type:complete len:202 (-) Transcript_125791:226-831(-)